MGPMRIGPGTELGLQVALQGSILVFPPDRACRARVAHRTRLVHGAERERMIGTAEQAVHLDRGRVAGHDADMTH